MLPLHPQHSRNYPAVHVSRTSTNMIAWNVSLHQIQRSGHSTRGAAPTQVCWLVKGLLSVLLIGPLG